MEEIIRIIFFGKSVERFKVLTKSYLFLMSALLTNMIMNGLGYSFDKSVEISLTSIIDFVLSPQFMIALTIYFIIIGCNFFAIIFAIKLISKILSPLLPIIVAVLALPYRIVLYSFYRFFRNERVQLLPPKVTLSELAADFNMVYYDNGVTHKGKWFFVMEEVVNGLKTEPHIFYNVYISASICISTLIVFSQYELKHIIPTVYHFIKYFTFYYAVNSLVISWLEDNLYRFENIVVAANESDRNK